MNLFIYFILPVIFFFGGGGGIGGGYYRNFAVSFRVARKEINKKTRRFVVVV